MTESEKQIEVITLNSTIETIRLRIEELEKEDIHNAKEAIDLSRGMWDDATHAVYDFNDIIELQQFNSEIVMHKDWTQKVRTKLKLMRKMIRSPYFGRIDFKAGNKDTEMIVYIGLGSLVSSGAFKCVVYDWRAPISSMFYDFGIGQASYSSPSGVIDGSICLKRQYKVTDGDLVYLFDSDVKIDDDILQRELAQNAHSSLKVIINSIQKEQNEAIRRNLHENLLVLGPAGSGKTSIGLHRLAYLLYKERGHIASSNILIFTQSDVFNSYISSTIPELGEEDVSGINFMLLGQKYLSKFDRQQNLYEQLEYVLSGKDTEPRAAAIPVKYSHAFLDFTEQHVSRLAVTLDDITLYGRVICTGAELTQRYATERDVFRPMTRIKKVCDYVENKIKDYFNRHADKFKKHLLRQTVDAKDIDREFECMQADDIESTRNKIILESGLDASVLYALILQEYVEQNHLQNDICTFTQSQLDEGNLLFEDSLVLLCIMLLTGEISPIKTIQHVLVDEAQDYNELQHFIIKNLFFNSRFTILADMEQAMFPGINLRDHTALTDIYGGEVLRLNKSYRATKQLNHLSSKLLASQDCVYFDRSGDLPTVCFAEDTTLAIHYILHMPEYSNCQSIGIITRTAQGAVSLYESLNGTHDIKLISRSTDSFASGIVIIPVTLAKGLEFDGVIIPDCSASQFNGLYDKRILYLMCTRALHHLSFVCKDEFTSHLAPYSDCYKKINI